MREVKDGAYVGYATLKYPGLFHKYEILDKSLDQITHHDIVIFYKAYETNIEELVNEGAKRIWVCGPPMVQEIFDRAAHNKCT